MFFPLSTIKKFHAEIVFVAWLRDLSWEVKIVCLFLLESTSRKFLILLLFHLPVFYCKYRLHLLLFSLIVMAFPACTCEPVVYSTVSSFFFFAWCRAKVCRSGSKDTCTLQHRFLCFLLFLYFYFYSLSCIITHVCHFNSLSVFPQIWK